MNPAGQEIDVSTFSLQQLGEIEKQLTNELELMTNNLGNLQLANNKFNHSMDAVKDLASKPEGR